MKEGDILPANIYEVIALAMRYWFALLSLLIVFRTYRWLIRDRRTKHRRLRQLPDAGMIGEMVVLRGNDELHDGCLLPVPWEGCIGYLRGCDITVPMDGVANVHADVSFRKGVGLVVVPRRRRFVVIDGAEIRSRREAEAHPMVHGSELDIGECTLKLRVFMGLEMEHSARRLRERRAIRPQQEPQTLQTPQSQPPPLTPNCIITESGDPIYVTAPHPVIRDTMQNTMPQPTVPEYTAPQPTVPEYTAPNPVLPEHSAPQTVVRSEPAPVSPVRDDSVYMRPKPQTAPVRSHRSVHDEDYPEYSAQWDTRPLYRQNTPPAANPPASGIEAPRRRRRSEGRSYE